MAASDALIAHAGSALSPLVSRGLCFFIVVILDCRASLAKTGDGAFNVVLFGVTKENTLRLCVTTTAYTRIHCSSYFTGVFAFGFPSPQTTQQSTLYPPVFASEAWQSRGREGEHIQTPRLTAKARARGVSSVPAGARVQFIVFGYGSRLRLSSTAPLAPRESNARHGKHAQYAESAAKYPADVGVPGAALGV